LAAAADKEECTVVKMACVISLCNDKHRECKPWAAAGECAEILDSCCLSVKLRVICVASTSDTIQEEVLQALEAKEKEQQRLEE
jgi:hypothetical protein